MKIYLNLFIIIIDLFPFIFIILFIACIIYS